MDSADTINFSTNRPNPSGRLDLPIARPWSPQRVTTTEQLYECVPSLRMPTLTRSEMRSSQSLFEAVRQGNDTPAQAYNALFGNHERARGYVDKFSDTASPTPSSFEYETSVRRGRRREHEHVPAHSHAHEREREREHEHEHEYEQQCEEKQEQQRERVLYRDTRQFNPPRRAKSAGDVHPVMRRCQSLSREHAANRDRASRERAASRERVTSRERAASRERVASRERTASRERMRAKTASAQARGRQIEDEIN